MKHEQGETAAEQPDTGATPGSSGAAGGSSGGSESGQRRPTRHRRTRVGAAWAAVLVAIVLLVFLLIFILQNLETTTVDFLGFSGSVPLAIAMLFSAIAGAALVALLGVARMVQLRRANRTQRKSDQ